LSYANDSLSHAKECVMVSTLRILFQSVDNQKTTNQKTRTKQSFALLDLNHSNKMKMAKDSSKKLTHHLEETSTQKIIFLNRYLSKKLIDETHCKLPSHYFQNTKVTDVG
jgi:hypothetical protein